MEDFRSVACHMPTIFGPQYPARHHTSDCGDFRQGCLWTDPTVLDADSENRDLVDARRVGVDVALDVVNCSLSVELYPARVIILPLATGRRIHEGQGLDAYPRICNVVPPDTSQRTRGSRPLPLVDAVLG